MSVPPNSANKACSRTSSSGQKLVKYTGLRRSWPEGPLHKTTHDKAYGQLASLGESALSAHPQEGKPTVSSTQTGFAERPSLPEHSRNSAVRSREQCCLHKSRARLLQAKFFSLYAMVITRVRAVTLPVTPQHIPRGYHATHNLQILPTLQAHMPGVLQASILMPLGSSSACPLPLESFRWALRLERLVRGPPVLSSFQLIFNASGTHSRRAALKVKRCLL